MPNKLDPDQARHFVQTVCKDYQQMTKVASSRRFKIKLTYRHCNWYPGDLITSGFRSEKKRQNIQSFIGVQWLSGRVLDLRPRGGGFEPHRHHCVVPLIKNINPSLVLVQPKKTCPFKTEKMMMGCKESNQTNKQTKLYL